MKRAGSPVFSFVSSTCICQTSHKAVCFSCPRGKKRGHGQARSRNGLPPLTEDWELSRVARYKSRDMKDRGYFSHTSPTYGTPFQMIRAFGLTYRYAGENIAMGYASPQAVGESVVKPWEYYDNNIGGTLVLLDVMRRHGCKNIIFSSSATVYGDPAVVPITEDCPKGRCTNPYGQTKSMLEEIMTDLHTADVKNGDPNPWNVVLLRYFNPVGAHESGRIGEDPNGIPNNLMPYITQVAVGKLEKLHVFGDDYDTPDGTGVRDYIHVSDLAKGHVKALAAIEADCGVAVYNLGTGRGYSVLEMVRAFEEASGVPIPYVIDPRRPGDVAACWSDPGKANRELGWKAERGVAEMCRDSWNWQKNNPNGYGA